ncbi:MAG: T9SS type A sorting domain-containing protein, partial [Bacteroidia bacterium]|nr:T9SS type A sorting domain-containing protein [Bacteroidia bacterium]
EGWYNVTVNGVCGANGEDSVRVTDDELEARFGYAFTYGRNFSFYDRSLGFPHAYLWDFGDGTYSSEMNPSHLYSSTGFFTVKLTVWSDCGMETITEDVSIFNLSVEELENTLTVYPNPTQGKVNIRLENNTANFDVTVVDMTGKVFAEYNDVDENTAIDLTDLSTGFYFLKIRTEDNVIQTKVYKM